MESVKVNWTFEEAAQIAEHLKNDLKLDRILLKVQKPGRYVGGEFNAIVKDWDSVRTRVAFVFPDIYDIGISNVGLKILYDQVNQRDDSLAERAYAPWTDMEEMMRANDIPLYALESKQPLACFDLIGFTLPYETLYTNALNILDLAGIPIRSADRDETHPIIIAGGHSTMNPCNAGIQPLVDRAMNSRFTWPRSIRMRARP